MIPQLFRYGVLERGRPRRTFDGGRIEHLARSVKIADPVADGTILAILMNPEGSFSHTP
jgi:hypothetical protein